MKFQNLLIFLFIHINLYSQSLETVINKFSSSTFRANLTIEQNGSSIIGKIYYQQGNVHFQLNDGRIVASNTRYIIVYDPETKVLGKQEKSSGGDLSWVLKYPYKIVGNKAIIEPENENPYKKIIISWNSDNFPILIQFLSDEKSITYRFSGITYLNNLPSSLFSYKPPAGSRSVENPLNEKK
jgi:hypothetical protein